MAFEFASRWGGQYKLGRLEIVSGRTSNPRACVVHLKVSVNEAKKFLALHGAPGESFEQAAVRTAEAIAGPRGVEVEYFAAGHPRNSWGNDCLRFRKN